MNILVCNSSLKSVYIDRPYFIDHPGSVIHTLYGWLVIFISFCFDKFLIKSSNTLRFLICSFIYLSIHSLICIFTVFKVIPNVCYDILFRFISGGFLGQLWPRRFFRTALAAAAFQDSLLKRNILRPLPRPARALTRHQTGLALGLGR